MADESSNLKAQIAFLTNLIKSHKQTTQTSDDRRHVSQEHHNNKQSFSWQRRKQAQAEKQPTVVRTPSNPVQNQSVKAKSLYILDKRTTAGRDSGQLNNTRTSLNVVAIPGSSGLYPVVTMNNDNPLVSNYSRTTTNQNTLFLSCSKATTSSKTSALSSNVVPSTGSCDVKLSPQLSSSRIAKNPYALNKKQKERASSGKTVAQKSEMKWLKPVVENSSRVTDDTKSHSDSELYTKDSSVLTTGQSSSVFVSKGKLPVLMHQKAPSTSNLHGSFKWSKPLSTASNVITSENASAVKTKIAISKLKWSKPGIDAQPGNKRPKNPYVLKKSNLASRNSSQKQGLVVSKRVNRHKLTKKAVYPAPSQSSLVWRAPDTLKLDRRSVQSTLKSISKKPSSGFIERRQRAVLKDNPVVTRFSVVRSKRKQAPIKAQKLNKVVVIEGVPYKTSSNKLRKTKSLSTRKESKGKLTSLSRTKKTGKLSKTVTIQGEKFAMDSKGKKLQRVNRVPQHVSLNKPSSLKQSQGPAGRKRLSSGRKIILRTPTTLIRSKVSNSQNKILASRVLRRSINNARLYKKSKRKPPSEQYCMFYNRFGKCNKQATCPYIHDPSKVAVCTKFLRGRCKNTDGSCPFSHKIDRDKMPVCQFFLRGKCYNDNCPYSHVNVNKKAEVCEDFLKGFCSLGQQCTKKHILECEEFSRTGNCSKGSKCKLMHRKRKPVPCKRKSSFKEEKDNFKLSKLDFTGDDGFLPLTASPSDSDPTSAQEPLENIPEEAKEKAEEPLVIRPRFLKPKEAAK